MNSDFSELLSIFTARKIDFLVVGGYALIEYVEPRYTKDIDIWIAVSPENSEKVFRALAEFGAPLAGLTESSLNGLGKTR